MQDNVFIFIIWKNAMEKYNQILKDIKISFKVKNIFKVVWEDEEWANNLSRFYGTSLPNESSKEIHCGKDFFKLIVVEDPSPTYDYRETSHGIDYVNINIFEKKLLYREWTGGGHKVHCTNDSKETNHDLTLLFGLNTTDFLKKYKANSKEQLYKNNLVGCKQWKSLDELFYTLNNTCNYLALRDYDNDFKDAYEIDDYDIDMLCENVDEIKWILNAQEVYLDNHIQYAIKLLDHNVIIDLKDVEDGYYDQCLSKDLLKTKLIHNGYYIPEREMAYYSCLYHALVHKDNFETEYNARLHQVFPEYHDVNQSKKYYCNLLSDWLKKKGYGVVIQKKNPFKMNVENIKLIDIRLYNRNIFEEIELRKESQILKNNLIDKSKEVGLQQEELNKLNEQLEILTRQHEKVINSRGWILLEKLRKLKRKVFKKR